MGGGTAGKEDGFAGLQHGVVAQEGMQLEHGDAFLIRPLFRDLTYFNLTGLRVRSETKQASNTFWISAPRAKSGSPAAPFWMAWMNRW